MLTLNKKENIIQGIKFTLFEASAGVIQFLSFALLHVFTKFTYWPCYLIALVLSVIWSFTFNRYYTFKSSKNIPFAMTQVFAYYVVFTPLSTWWGDALTKMGWDYYVVLIGTMIINFITEFLYQRFYVYRNSINSR
jgi:putative flippase GtrA